MKKGRVIFISKTFPEQSCFKDYNELRRHWKNIHGYRLPEDDEEMVYLGIRFFGSTVFTYPIHCVTTGISFLPFYQNYSNIISQFINDLRKTFPSVCGVPFHIADEFGFPAFSIATIKNSFETEHPTWTCGTSSSKFFSTAGQFVRNSLANKIDDEVPSSNQSSNFNDYDAYTQDISLCTPSQDLNDSLNNKLSQNNTIIPHFAKKDAIRQDRSKLESPFAPSTSQSYILNNSLENCDSFQKLMKPIKPLFSKPKKVNIFQILQKNHSNKRDGQNKQNVIISDSKNIIKGANYSKETLEEKKRVNVPKNVIVNDGVKQHPQFQCNLQKPNSSSTSNLDHCTKRNYVSSEPKKKKICNKQLNCSDIKEMAINGTITKANMQILAEYLKLNNIPYKSKDKKLDLINKVLNHLNISVNTSV